MSAPMSRRGLSPAQVVSVFLVVGGLSSIGWLLWERTGRLIPPAPWLAVVLFGLLVAFVLRVAWPVRAHVRGGTRVEPLRAARALVLAQAGALTGAAAAGWYAAQLALLLRGLDLTAYRERVWIFALLTLGATLLAAAGLWAQSWCRLPPQDPRHPDGADTPD